MPEQHSTGAVRDTIYHRSERGYPLRFDLVLSNDVGFRRLAETFGEGFLKYGADNWKNGFEESILINHCLQHLTQHLAGDTTEDHLTHALWNLYTLLWMQEKRPDLMDLTGAKTTLDDEFQKAVNLLEKLSQ